MGRPRGISCWRRYAAALVATMLLAVALPSAGAWASEGPLYRAEGPRGTVYLFGTVHLGRADFYPLDQRVYAALDASSIMLVELDVANLPQKQAVKLMAMMVLPRGEKLEKRVGAALWKRTAKVAEDFGMPSASLQTLQPWSAAMTLGFAPLMKAGLDPFNGVDQHMLAEARRRNKPIGELEQAEDQIGIFESLGADESTKLLALTVEQLESEKGKREMLELVGAWRDGDGDAIERILNHYLRRQSPELTHKLLDLRNTKMVDKTLAALKRSAARTVMVVVGAGHLPGEGGMVDLLRRKGFEITKQ